MAHIDYYFATISPFTYLAGTGLEKVAEKHGATITYKPVDIMALFARTGARRHRNGTRIGRLFACKICAVPPSPLTCH